MLLVVDVGNTHITLGVFDGKELCDALAGKCDYQIFPCETDCAKHFRYGTSD